MIELRGLPTPWDYDAATELQDGRYSALGGAWGAAYQYEMDAHRSPDVYDELVSVGSLACEVEVLTAEGTPLDELRHATHAFKHGMVSGNRVIELAHNDFIHWKGIIRYLAAQIRAQENHAVQYVRASTLVEMGEQGLEFAGEKATERIVKWGEDAVSDVRSQRMYNLGCGAVIFAGYSIHRQFNSERLEKIVASIDWQGELDRLSPTDTGE